MIFFFYVPAPPPNAKRASVASLSLYNMTEGLPLASKSKEMLGGNPNAERTIMTFRNAIAAGMFVLILAVAARAEVGDPQIRTDHPWYPGELACSTFERLFKTQAEVYERVVGVKPVTDEQKALAAWLWRNTHYYHGEEGTEDLWGQGFTKGQDLRTREYWTGMFAHGFGLCGTTHAQWTAEMQALLGHNRGRAVGVAGHNSFEIFLTGGLYGAGKWVLFDHDISTVIYNADGSALLSLAEIQRDWKRLTNRAHDPKRQHGWPVCGLHPDDGGVYASYEVAEYFPGYSGPPPMVHLRRGETLRRFPQPGLADGKTFVFWGRNYNTAGIPGPERAHTWVNQPDKMYQSKSGAGYKPGQARYGNAQYVYKPDFASKDYREGVIAEDDRAITFEFYTPYIIGATPANPKPWGVYDVGCKNGLVLRGKADCAVSISTDQGKTWTDGGKFVAASDLTDPRKVRRVDWSIDLTDHVKGRRQYWLRFHAGAKALQESGLTITTTCQANAAVMPRLKDSGTSVSYLASGKALVSAGPNLAQAQAHVVEGKFGSPRVTLELAAPRGEKVIAVYAAAHVQSSSPPRSDVKYHIDVSTDGGATWKPIVKDWTISRRGDEPRDFWSQSLCWGTLELDAPKASSIRVRFHNTGGKNYARAEAHLVYRPARQDATKVTFAWTDDRGERQASHTFAPPAKQTPWEIATGRNVQTRWIELEPVAVR